MCAIIGSFSRDKLIELAQLNSNRGNFSYSITSIHPLTREYSIIKSFGDFMYDYQDGKILKDWVDGLYYICHIQAPTSATTSDVRRIHPSEIEVKTHVEGQWKTAGIGKSLLWHNGVLKYDWYTQSEYYDRELSWDTDVLHKTILNTYDASKIDGQFSCVFLDSDGLFLFRNEEAPMYIDNSMNISSTSFNGSFPTLAGLFYSMNLHDKRYDIVAQFECKSNAYFFGE